MPGLHVRLGARATADPSKTVAREPISALLGRTSGQGGDVVFGGGGEDTLRGQGAADCNGQRRTIRKLARFVFARWPAASRAPATTRYFPTASARRPRRPLNFTRFVPL